jgi:hypothetical protein
MYSYRLVIWWEYMNFEDEFDDHLIGKFISRSADCETFI